MRLLAGNAKITATIFVSFFLALFGLAGPASAQNYNDRFEAEFVLLGPRIESGLTFILDQARDERYCSMSQEEVRRKLRKSSSGVVAAAFEILREARIRCEARKYGFIDGFHASFGVGGSFGLDQSTETQNIGSAGVYDPVDAASRKVGLGASGLTGQIGIGYDWKIGTLFSPKLLGKGGGFIGVNIDASFGGGSKTIEGIPGIVPFIPAGVAMMDKLRFRNDVTVDFTARIGAYITPSTAVYALGGLSLSQISLKYDCSAAGFCGVAPATPAFSAETTKWATGGVIGVGIETKVDWIALSGVSVYLEYRARLMSPIAIDVGTVATRSTSQEVDMSMQSVLGGARIKF